MSLLSLIDASALAKPAQIDTAYVQALCQVKICNPEGIVEGNEFLMLVKELFEDRVFRLEMRFGKDLDCKPVRGRR